MKQLAAVCLLSATLGCGDGGQIQPESVDALREPAEALRERAEQGDAVAQAEVGNIYRSRYPRGPQDDVEAVRWYRLAAEQEDAYAQYALGVHYSNGQGVPQDRAEAARWYRLAAEQGYADAHYALGFYYSPHDLDADAALQDYVQAHLWFNLAASRLTGDRRERTVTNRDRAASELTPAALNEAQRLAREWEAAHPR